MTTAFSRKLTLAHYTSYDIRSRDPSPSTWIPLAKKTDSRPAHMLEADLVPLRDCYVYVFLEEGAAQATLPLFTDIVPMVAGNPLFRCIYVDASGDLSECHGLDARNAAAVSSNPQMTPTGRHLTLPIEQAGTRLCFYFLVSRIPLPLPTIEQLERVRPPQLPLIDLQEDDHLALIEMAQESSAEPDWALLLVDPITVTQNLTKKYRRTADRYLAKTQPYAQVNDETSEAALLRQAQAEMQRLKKLVAESVKAVLDGAGKSLDVDEPKLRHFLEEFDAGLESRATKRDNAAVTLIHWIRSNLWHIVENSYREGKPDGELGDDYNIVLEPFSQALARLAETNAGVLYLLELIGAADSGDLLQTNAFAMKTFFLRDESSLGNPTKVAKAAYASGANFVAAWGAVVNAIMADCLAKMKEMGPRSVFGATLIPDDLPSVLSNSLIGANAFRLKSALNRALGIEIAQLDVTTLTILLPGETGPLKVMQRVGVLDASYALASESSAAAKKCPKITHSALNKVLSALNIALAAGNLIEAFQGKDNLRERVFSVVGLTQSVVSFAGDSQAFVSFWQRLHGKTDFFGKPLLQAGTVSGVTGLVGSTLSLLSAGNDAFQDWRTKDYDAFAGNVGQGIGAALSGIGFGLTIKSGITGPAAGYFLMAGSVIGIAGYVWTAFADDDLLNEMVKFSAFGKYPGADAPAPAWALCEDDNFKHWNPETELGLTTQLHAFRNVFFSFVAGRPDNGPNNVLRLFPSALRVTSAFEITFIAHYSTYLPRTVPESDVRRAGHLRTTRVRVVPNDKTMEILEGAPVEPNRVTIGGTDTAPVIDVTVEPLATGDDRAQVTAFRQLDKLECLITLDVFGDGVTTFIPADKGGAAKQLAFVVWDTTARVQENQKASASAHS